MRLSYIVSKNIKYYREKVNMTDKDLSMMLGRDEEFIYKLENNKLKKTPPLSLIEKVASILKVSVKDLVDDAKCK